MSNRYPRMRTIALCMIIVIGSTAMARQAARPTAPAAPAQAPAAAAPGGVNLNVSQIPLPAAGAPFRFSLCLGRHLEPGEVSAPCRTGQTNASQTVGGTEGNSVVTFRLENGSWLPPGLVLDGFGVITGTPTVDVSKVKVKICAIQLGAIGTNFNCQGKPVGFGKSLELGNTPPPPPAPTAVPDPNAPAEKSGGGGGKAILGATALAAAGAAGLAALKAASSCPSPPQVNYHACLTGQSCSACSAGIVEYEPFCECLEKGGAGLGTPGGCRQAQANMQAQCLAPNASLVPKLELAVRR